MRISYDATDSITARDTKREERPMITKLIDEARLDASVEIIREHAERLDGITIDFLDMAIHEYAMEEDARLTPKAQELKRALCDLPKVLMAFRKLIAALRGRREEIDRLQTSLRDAEYRLEQKYHLREELQEACQVDKTAEPDEQIRQAVAFVNGQREEIDRLTALAREGWTEVEERHGVVGRPRKPGCPTCDLLARPDVDALLRGEVAGEGEVK